MNIPLAKIPILNKRVRFPVSPHIPGGLATPADLCRIAAVAEKYGGTIKIAGGNIVIIGLTLADGEAAMNELGMKPESFLSNAIRSVTMCAGKPDCPRAQQDSTALGLALDEEFFDQQTPGKLRIGVSGCPNCCAEVFVKDIGLFGKAAGFTVILGGSSGRQAQVGRIAAVNVPADEVAALIRRIVDYYRNNAKNKERLGQTISRLGLDHLVAQAIPLQYRLAE